MAEWKKWHAISRAQSTTTLWDGNGSKSRYAGALGEGRDALRLVDDYGTNIELSARLVHSVRDGTSD